MSGVNVLAAMELAANNLRNLGCSGSAGDVVYARDVVADLILAARRLSHSENNDGCCPHVVSGEAMSFLDSVLARIGGA